MPGPQKPSPINVLTRLLNSDGQSIARPGSSSPTPRGNMICE